jgi:hypothetical protein
MRTAASILSVVVVGTAAAQTPPARQDPSVTAPMVTQQGTPASQRQPAASRHQFFNAPMGIQIEGEGLTLPKGVAEDPVVPPAAAKPAAETKPADQAPTQK